MGTAIKSTLISLIFFSLTLGSLDARETQSFRAKTQVPIKEKDVVYARNQAFADLRRELIQKGVADLIGSRLYRENERYLRNQIRNDQVITRVKIVRESANANSLSLSLIAWLRMKPLERSLRQLGFPLAKDPAVPIGLLIDQTIPLPVNKIKSRLALLKLRVQKQLSYSSATLDAEQLESLFEQLGSPSAAILIEPIPGDSPGKVQGITARVVRLSDFQIAQNLVLNFEQREADQIGTYLKRNLERFLSLFSVQNLQHSDFTGGKKRVWLLELVGLTNPKARYLFEETCLKPNRQIEAFELTHRSSESSRYRVYSAKSAKELALTLFKPSAYFSFQILTEEGNQTQVQVLAQSSPKMSPPRPILQVQEWRKKILLALGLNEKAPIPPEWGQLFREGEPNNTSLELTPVLSEQVILGRLNSRADEDLFLLPGENKKTLIIDWLKLGKSYLRPLLRLYDDQFNLLASWPMQPSRSKKHLIFHFKGKVPNQLHLRVYDRIGYIHGETGGFRFFEYLLRYRFSDG